MQYVIFSYFECRMENRTVLDEANEEFMVVDECEEEEMTIEDVMVVDECNEERTDAQSASAGNGFIQFYYSIDE